MSDAPVLLLLALPVLLLALACSATSDAAPSGELAGTFGIERIAGRPVVGDGPARLTLGADGAVSGHAGLNRFTGTWTRDGETLGFSQLAATKMAGSPARMEQEQRLFDALGRVERARLAGDVLVLSSADGEELVRARRSAG